MSYEHVAGWVPYSRELAEDVGLSSATLQSMFGGILRRQLEPWLYPDDIRWPAFDPFPRLTRAEAVAREARRRTRAAWSMIRHGTTPVDDDWWG